MVSRRIALVALVLLAAAVSGRAQDGDAAGAELKWKLAPTDFARYRLSKITTAKDGKETLSPITTRLAGLFGREISNGVQYIPPNPVQPEIPLIVGLNLPPRPLKDGSSARWAIELRDSVSFSPVYVEISAKRVRTFEDDGRRMVEVELKAQIVPHPSAKPALFQKPVDRGTMAATLLFDATSGVVHRVRYDASLTFKAPEENRLPETVRQVELLELVQVVPHRYPEFERDVTAAIDKGVAWLWKQHDGAAGGWQLKEIHKGGYTAFALLAILKGSLDRSDPRLLKSLEWLLAQPFQFTYDTALSLMALEAFYSPRDPADRVKPSARSNHDILKSASSAHVAWAAKAAAWLEGRMNSDGLWGYPDAKQGHDFSNTHYALLGLFASARFGAFVDDSVYLKVMNLILRNQDANGPKGIISLVTGVAGGSDLSTVEFTGQSRGWRYGLVMTYPAYGSMTAGGLSSLAILDSILRRLGTPKYDATLKKRVNQALVDGFLWMQEHWSVKTNPEIHENRSFENRQYLYYLYGLERAAMLNGVARIGPHDWYYEGSCMLLGLQRADGGWAVQSAATTTHETCFALLFLKRATIRVATLDLPKK